MMHLTLTYITEKYGKKKQSYHFYLHYYIITNCNYSITKGQARFQRVIIILLLLVNEFTFIIDSRG